MRKFSFVLVGLLFSVYSMADKTETIYGSGGKVVVGNIVQYCPNPPQNVCAIITVPDDANNVGDVEEQAPILVNFEGAVYSHLVDGSSNESAPLNNLNGSDIFFKE